MQIRIKFCGITNVEDALAAADAGAWAIGLNFYAGSPRCISLEAAAGIVEQLPKRVRAAGVFVNASADHIKSLAEATGITMIQLHGDEPADLCSRFPGLEVIKAFRVQTVEDLDNIDDYGAAHYLLVDAAVDSRFGGTGQLSNWEVAGAAARHRRLILAGGLTPENVAAACAAVHPYAVDVASGVEERAGKKSRIGMASFAKAVRSACGE